MNKQLQTRRHSRRLALRPLLCEQLERRYALHGMGWFASSTDHSSLDEIMVYEDGSSFQYAQVRSISYVDRYSARPEPKFVEGEAVSNASTFDDLADSDRTYELSDRHDCARNRTGLGPGEGEGRGPRTQPGRSSESSAIDWFRSTPPALSQSPITAPPSLPPQNDIGRQPPTEATSADNRPGEGKPNTGAGSSDAGTVNDNKAFEVALRAVVESLARSSTSATAIDNSARSAFAGILGSNADPGPAATPSRVDSLIPGRSTGSLPGNGFNPSPVVTSTLSANVADTRSSLSSANDASQSGSTSELLRSSNNAVLSGRIDTEASWQRSSERTAATGDSPSQRDADEQLRSVIENIAVERTKEKSSSERKLDSSSSDRANEQIASTEKRMLPAADGMLELAAATDRLAPTPRSAYDDSPISDTVPQHTQLFASLELNREFELAGPSIQLSPASLEEADGQAANTNLFASAMGEWGDQPSDLIGPNADHRGGEASLWQQTILPLSLLAISGLLIRSRKHFYQTKN